MCSLPVETICKYSETYINSLMEERLESFLFVDYDFFLELQKKLNGATYKKPAKNRRFERTLYKYLSRMVVRPVPFGLFSSVGMIAISDKTEFKKIALEKKVSVNNDVLWDLSNKARSVSTYSILTANETTFVHNGRIKFYRYDHLTGKLLMQTMEHDEYLLEFLKWVWKNSSADMEKAVKFLKSDFGLSTFEAEGFVRLLVENGLLISGNMPWSSDRSDFLDRLIHLGNALFSPKKNLVQIKKSLLRIEKENPANGLDAYLKIVNILDSHGVRNKKIFKAQVNIQPKGLSIAREEVDRVGRIVEKLLQFTQVERIDLSDFVRKMLELDNFSGKLIDAVHLFDRSERRKTLPEDLKRQIRPKLNKTEIELEEIKPDMAHMDGFNDSVSILAKKLPTGFLFRKLLNGTKEGFLNRYSSSNKDVQEFINEQKEIRNGVIYLGINVLPHVRAYNIVNANSSSRYELFFERNCAKEAIAIDDIGITVNRGKVILFSFIHKKRVIPRFPNIIAPDLYREDNFLSLLYHIKLSNRPNVEFVSWKTMLELGSYEEQKDCLTFPRITFKSHILSPRTWLFKKTDAPFLSETNLSALPDFFLLIDNNGDEMIVNKNIKVSMDILMAELHKGNVVLQEFIKGCKGIPLEHEMLLDFNIGKEKAVNYYDLIRRETNSPNYRMNLINNNWVYLKIYFPKEHSNELIKKIGSILGKLLPEEKNIKYFFVRFNDGRDHVRIRVLNVKKRKDLSKEISTAIGNSFQNAEIKEDKYLRESRRYFYHDMDVVEDIFCVDSKYALDLLSLEPVYDLLYCCLTSKKDHDLYDLDDSHDFSEPQSNQ